jgi:fibro-slime domain-containing protein
VPMNRSTTFPCVLACFLGSQLTACSAESPTAGGPTLSATAGAAGTGPSSAGGGGTGTAGSNGSGGLMISVPPLGGTDSGGTSNGTPIMLTDVIKTELGGYKLGADVTNGVTDGSINVDSNDGCGVLVGVVRDFNTKGLDKHPDFESFSGSGAAKGLVAPSLDAERKPIYASQCEELPDETLCPTGQQTTSKAAFDQWYRSTPGTNYAYLLYFQMEPVGNVVSFQSDNFVPVDNVGFNDTTLAKVDDMGDGLEHNYGFTTELHLKFKYSGGETFSFIGDDDVWAFINGHLAIDLGGLHPASTDSIVLDDRAAELGLVKGNVYPLDLFQAERHSTGSHYRIDSTLSFVDCGSVPDPK